MGSRRLTGAGWEEAPSIYWEPCIGIPLLLLLHLYLGRVQSAPQKLGWDVHKVPPRVVTTTMAMLSWGLTLSKRRNPSLFLQKSYFPFVKLRPEHNFITDHIANLYVLCYSNAKIFPSPKKGTLPAFQVVMRMGRNWEGKNTKIGEKWSSGGIWAGPATADSLPSNYHILG